MSLVAIFNPSLFCCKGAKTRFDVAYPDLLFNDFNS